MAKDFAKSSELAASEAATRLELTPQAVRDRIRAGSLAGRKDEHGRWRVRADAVPPPRALVSNDLSALTIRVEELERQLSTILAAQAGDAGRVERLSAERDRFRSDAAAAREAAARLNIALAEVRATARSLLNALDAQSEALTQLLAPGSPADLPPKH